MREFDLKFKDDRGREARHNVQLYDTDSGTTILATDRSARWKCASVTNSIELLVAELVEQERLDPARMVVIEHYDDLTQETWDKVVLERRHDGSFTNPEWKPITKAEVERLCGLEVQV